MEAIREIRKIDSDRIVIEIPKELREKKVEIIVLPMEETAEKSDRFSRFLENPIRIEGFQMPSRDQRNAR